MSIASNNPLILLSESKSLIIPRDVLEEIFFKGVHLKHLKLKKYLSEYDQKERYNAFVRLYKPVPYILGAIYFMYFLNENVNIENLEESKILKRFSDYIIKESNKLLEENDESLKGYGVLEESNDDMRERLYMKTVDTFIEKNKRNPTSKEDKEFRKAFDLN